MYLLDIYSQSALRAIQNNKIIKLLAQNIQNMTKNPYGQSTFCITVNPVLTTFLFRFKHQSKLFLNFLILGNLYFL